MRILFLGPLPEPVTGHSLACQVLYDALLPHHVVDVVNLSKSEFRHGFTSLTRVFEVLSMLCRIWRRRRGPDVIYFTISESIAGNLKDLLIYAICFTRLRRMAIHLHGGAGMTLIMSQAHPLLRWLNAFFLRRLGAAIVLGNRHSSIFAGVLPRERIHAVANFAQDELFNDMQSVDRKFARTTPLRVLFLSNLLSGKGHVELVQALRILEPAERSRLAVDFAGGFESPAHEQQFRADISGLGDVCYHGTVKGDSKRRLLHAAHVFCLPTYYAYEGQPISILEAYAAGCAVITTDHSGIFDIFRDGANGFAVAKGSADALAVVLRAALAAPARLHEIAMGNLEAAQQNYRTSRHTRELIAILTRVHAQAS